MFSEPQAAPAPGGFLVIELTLAQYDQLGEANRAELIMDPAIRVRATDGLAAACVAHQHYRWRQQAHQARTPHTPISSSRPAGAPSRAPVQDGASSLPPAKAAPAGAGASHRGAPAAKSASKPKPKGRR